MNDASKFSQNKNKPLSFLQLRTLTMIGATLEFYDFVIFILFAPWIANTFFPESSTFSGIMPVLLLFAAGHFARPVGGIFFSHIGDRYGRKCVFLWTVVLMSTSTFSIGLLPSHAVLGDHVAFILLFLRLLQGLSLGGELPGSVVFASEHANHDSRGSTAGLVIFGFSCGNLLGSIMGLTLNNYLTDMELATWGWRIPFILGGFLGLIGYKLRKDTIETPIFAQIKENSQIDKTPLLTIIKRTPGRLLFGMSLALVPAIGIAVFLFLPRYFFHYLGHSNLTGFTISTTIFFIMCLTIIPSSFVSDKIGRRPLLLIGCSALLICNLLAFYLNFDSLVNDLLFLLLLGIPIGIIMSCYETTLVETFPTPLRNTGVAFCHNTTFAIFGGTLPAIFESLCSQGYLMSLPLIISGGSVLTIIVVLYMPDRSKHHLNQIE